MLRALYKNYILHHALSVNCKVSLRVVLTARRIVFAINLADEGRAFQVRVAASPATREGVIAVLSGALTARSASMLKQTGDGDELLHQ